MLQSMSDSGSAKVALQKEVDDLKQTVKDKTLNINKLSYTPYGTSYNTIATMVPGYMIKLPFGMEMNTMVAFTITIYASYEPTKLFVSGYLYTEQDKWYIPRVYLIAGSGATVKFGKADDGKAYVWVSGGNYAGISVTDITVGFNGMDFSEGWEIVPTESDEVPNVEYVETVKGTPRIFVYTTPFTDMTIEPNSFYNLIFTPDDDPNWNLPGKKTVLGSRIASYDGSSTTMGAGKINVCNYYEYNNNLEVWIGNFSSESVTTRISVDIFVMIQ